MAPPQTALPAPIPNQPPGLVMGVLMDLLLRPVTVARVEALSRRFSCVSLRGDAFKRLSWTPGDKLQVAVGGASFRTFSPHTWDPVGGETRFLAYTHGEGLAATWLSAIRPGMPCRVFGPHHSLPLQGIGGERTVLFGDETSFGIALGLLGQLTQLGEVALILEVDDPEEAQAVWAAVAQASPASHVSFVRREPDDAHLGQVGSRVTTLLTDWTPDRWILTGKASSIRSVRRVLKSAGFEAWRIKAKVFWSPGKTGLD